MSGRWVWLLWVGCCDRFELRTDPRQARVYSRLTGRTFLEFNTRAAPSRPLRCHRARAHSVVSTVLFYC